MKEKEFTKQELIDIISKIAIDEKITFNSLRELLVDSEFPEKLSESSTQEINITNVDEKRFLEIANILSEKCKKAYEIQKEIVKLSIHNQPNVKAIQLLKTELSYLESDITNYETELAKVKQKGTRE